MYHVTSSLLEELLKCHGNYLLSRLERRDMVTSLRRGAARGTLNNIVFKKSRKVPRNEPRGKVAESFPPHITCRLTNYIICINA